MDKGTYFPNETDIDAEDIVNLHVLPLIGEQ